MQIAIPSGPKVSAFSKAISTLTNGDDAPVLLAVSGGPDSLAMLLLAKASFPDRIKAATVDHRLRKEAANEADYVSQICAQLDVPHAILKSDQPITGNIQSNARALRYQLLQDHAKSANCKWIATAHHADDQLETLLMRIMRGSGVDGLAAVRAQNGNIIRPCLEFTKAELVDICNSAGLEPVEDPSNENTDFDRVALRQWLAASNAPFDSKRALRTAAALSDASDALNWAVDQLKSEHLVLDAGSAVLTPADLPYELLRRLLLIALRHIQADIAPRGDTIDRALTDLPMGKKLSIGDVLCEGGEAWRFSAAPPRQLHDKN